MFSSAQLICNPMDCSLPGSFVHGILQQEYWSGLPFPLPGDLPHPGIEPVFLYQQAYSLLLGHLGSPVRVYSGVK